MPLAGGLFNDTGDELGTIQERTFKFAIHKVNKDLEGDGISFKYETKRYDPEKNSLLANEKGIIMYIVTLGRYIKISIRAIRFHQVGTYEYLSTTEWT